jgi:glucose/arabinose dehydrogenase
MAWIDRKLWTVVNERDLLGDDLVPDYLTHVEEDAFYGWPYTYFGNHKDARVTEPAPALVKETRVPDVALVSHTASLGLAYINNKSFPEDYREGVLIAQHGSWNRSVLSGYKVLFVPFRDGKPAGKHKDFLTGFVADLDHEKVHGRPVCVMQKTDGAILVTDDTSNVIWEIRRTGH